MQDYVGWEDECDVAEMKGMTIESIDGGVLESDQITFNMGDGNKFIMYHDQD